MSDSLYQYTDSENEMIDPMHASRTTDTSGRSRVDTPDEDAPTPPPPTKRRTPIPNPRKPARPASISGAQPLDSSSRDTSILMDDISIPKQNFYEEVDIGPTRSNPLLSSTPVQQQDKPSIPQSQPDRSGSILPERAKPTSAPAPPDKTRSSPAPALSKEEREKQKLKNMIKAADKPNAVTTNDDDDFEKTFTQRHKLPIMIVVFLLILGLAIALGIGARSASIVSYAEAFSQSKGMPCNHICTNSDRYSTPPLIVIALNGFSSSFFEYKSVVSNLARLAECGVHGNTIPSYPSTAIPNLYSIITGIHPAYHGKASDWLRIYGLNETQFGPADQPNTYSRMDPRWFQHNGLWGLAANEGLLTASHSWIGREGDIDEELPPSPSYYQTFDRDVDYKARIETVLNWLHLEPSLRPSFITVYFEDPGKTAKLHGFNSKVTMNSLARIDSAIGLLLDSLFEEQNLGCVNIMVVSTGGLAERHCNRAYYLSDDLQNLADFSLLPDSVTSIGKITATDKSPLEMDSPEEIVKHLQCKVSHGQVFTKRLLPVRFHASYGLQSEDVMVLMEPGWTIAKQPEGYDRNNCKGATDGFDSYSHDMQGLFIGFGKDFRLGKTIPTVRNVDLFHLMADLINVTAPTNNGTRNLITMALKWPKMQEMVAMEFSPARNAECSYPSNDEYDQRQRDENTGCECTQETLNSYSETSGVLLRDKDDNIGRTVAVSRQQNAPFGIPQVLSDVGPSGQDYCELFQNNFIAAYENNLKLPLFATFTVRRNSPTVPQIRNCLRYDVRLQPEKTPKCSSYNTADNSRLPINIVQGFLYEPALANSIDNELNALTTANIVPQYANFKQNVWLPLAGKIRQWANEGNRSADMNVLVGPVYDWDSDTRRDTYHQVASSQAWVTDTPVPSHYFIVATRCKEDVALNMCPIRSIDVVSFVLPHTDSVNICKMFDDYLLTHLASLQDVELITGLQLFPDLNNEDNSVENLLLLKTQICPHGWHGAERCE